MRFVALFLLFSISIPACTHSRDSLLVRSCSDGDAECIVMRQAEREQALLEGSSVIYRDREIETYLKQLTRVLLPPDFPGDLSFTVRMISNPDMNAFAFPDGHIYIYCGMLARMENEAQLAVVLAHEMAHVAHKHAFRAYRELEHEATTGFGGVGGLRGPSGLGAFGTDYVRGYSREFENEADRTALEWTSKAGYDPREALRLLARLKDESEKEKGDASLIVACHPSLDERIKRHMALLAFSPEKRGGIRNEGVFFSKIGRVIFETARLDLKAGRFQSASIGVERYLRTRPDDPKAYYLMGEIYRQRARVGDAKRAMDAYRQAIALDASFADPQEAMGILYLKQGKMGLARRHLEACLSLSPETSDKAYILGYLRRCNH